MSAHVLQGDKNQPPGQVYGRLLGYAQKKIARFRSQVSAEAGECYLPQTTSLNQAGGPEIRTFTGHTLPVTSVALSADGCRGLSGSNDNTLKLWDLESGESTTVFSADAPVGCCAFSHDLDLIVAGDTLGRLHILRLTTPYRGKKRSAKSSPGQKSRGLDARPTSTPVFRPKSKASLSRIAGVFELGELKGVMVLIGGASGLDPKISRSLSGFFSKVLARVAAELALCVIDGGTDAGVMSLMGRARSKVKGRFPLVGVAPRDMVHLPGKQPARSKAVSLEPNHSHFVLVPGRKWSDESLWIDALARSLGRKLPAFTLLVNGGEISRRDVELSLKVKRP